ncbi:hypothetical protein PIROE2DRAFT_64437 [Piromyces sp. E2]|nr:hypothetical protein PIROE2DRAFT_64437 [Piromyces sp. E2]|eukprot:OUM58392.1 hypothetical protein PIROE2DRAFT_64437 [Piromyces sp. E2]
MPFIKKAKNTHFIESVLKKCGIINKHTAAIESVMQNMSEITEKARQAQCLDHERTQAYNEELKRQQIMAIFSSNYSFNIDDLEIVEGNEGNENGETTEVNNQTSVDEDSENVIDMADSRLQSQSSQTMKTDRISMNTSNSVLCQNQQQTIPSNNQQLVYTNPNSRSIPNSKSQGSSLKYISSHSLIKQGPQGISPPTSSHSSQIKQDKLANSKSNSLIMGRSEDSRSRMFTSNSKSNSMLMNNKNENESRSKIMRMNSKHSSISIISNTQMAFSKQNSQKIVGSEVFELVRDTSVSNKNIERNNSYNFIKETSTRHLIREEEEDEIKALNENVVDSRPVFGNYQISQPNILGKFIYYLKI